MLDEDVFLTMYLEEKSWDGCVPVLHFICQNYWQTIFKVPSQSHELDRCILK